MFRRITCLFSTSPPLVRWRPVEVSHFDVCIIGAGPAGIAAALRAVDYNKRVCLIEANRIGGVDLWNGTLQSKTLWEMSNFLAKANGSAALRVYNKTISSFMELDEERLRETLIRNSVLREQQTLAALRAAKVTLLYGYASFASPQTLEVRNRESKEYHTVTSDYFIIATGSTPVDHPYVKLDGKRVITSDQLMQMPLPKSMVIVGAGVLGSEFAGIYARLGKTQVYLLDKEECIMPKEDDDIIAKIQESMEAHGVIIHRDSVLYDMQSWEEDENEIKQHHPEDPTKHSGVRYTIMHRKTRELHTFEVQRALIAVGRRPNYAGLALHNAGCEVRDGALVLDKFGCCIGQRHIFAIGDAANDSKLVSVGEAKGRQVVDYIFSALPVEPLQEMFPRLIFLTIAIASVGMNEKQCQRNNTSYIMAKYGFEFCSRTVAADNTAGFVKIIATNDSKKTLLGVRVVGMNASSIIELATAAIIRKQSIYELSELLTAYPSVSQAFLECLRVLLGTSVLKPGTFPGLVCQTWSPPAYDRGRAYKLTLEDEKDRNQEVRAKARQQQYNDNNNNKHEKKEDEKKEKETAPSREFQEWVTSMSTEELYEVKRLTEAMATDAAAKVDAEALKKSTNKKSTNTVPASSSSFSSSLSASASSNPNNPLLSSSSSPPSSSSLSNRAPVPGSFFFNFDVK